MLLKGSKLERMLATFFSPRQEAGHKNKKLSMNIYLHISLNHYVACEKGKALHRCRNPVKMKRKEFWLLDPANRHPRSSPLAGKIGGYMGPIGSKYRG